MTFDPRLFLIKKRGPTFASAVSATVSDSATTTSSDALKLTHRTDGTAAAGYGVGMLMRVEDDAGNVDDAARVAAVLTDAASGSEDTDLVVSLRDAGGALAEKFRVTSDGEVKLGTVAIDVSGSALRIVSGTNAAPQVPQMTTAQRDALTATNGMIVYNTTTGQFEGYDTSWDALGAGGAVPGTNALSYQINQDAVAGTDEDPYLIVTGGDGVEVVSTILRQDSSLDRVFLFSQLNSLADGVADRTTNITVGPHTSVNATTDDIDSTVTWRGHFATDAISTFKEATSKLDASASDWVFTAPAAFAISMASNLDAEAGLDVTGGAFSASGGTATINSTGATAVDASTTLTLCGTAGTPTIGRAGVTTTNAGALAVTEACTLSSTLACTGVATFSAAPVVAVNDASTSTIVTCATLKHTTTGAAANGIGSRLLYQSEDTAGNTDDCAAIDATFTDATSASEDSAIVMSTRAAGAALAEVARVDAAALTLAAGVDLTGAAGDGGLALGSLTGPTTLPTGSVSYTGASTKSVTITTTGAGSAINVTAGASSTVKTTAGLQTVDSAAALNLGTIDATSVSVSKAGVATTINGSATIVQACTLSSSLATTAVTTSSIAASVDDYTGANNAAFCRLVAGGAVNITGFAGGVNGRRLALRNGSGFTITLTHNDAASLAANRMSLSGGANVALTPFDTIELIYDATQALWCQLSPVVALSA